MASGRHIPDESAMVSRTIPVQTSARRDHRFAWLVAVAGAAIVLVGVLLMLDLVLATMTSVLLVGLAMAAVGVAQIAHGAAIGKHRHRGYWIALGCVYAVAGFAVWWDPRFAATAITLALAVLLVSAGLVRLALAAAGASAKGWLIASGLLTLAVGIVFVIGWPANALWVPGIMLVADLIVQGSLLMAIGIELRRAVDR
jgi:uncharacterized membrane protein HdeD (DUF308 family)